MRFYTLLTHDENMQHRGLRNLIEMIAMAGYRYRSEFRVVLYQGDAESDYDEDYATYLDLKAQGENPSMAVGQGLLMNCPCCCGPKWNSGNDFGERLLGLRLWLCNKSGLR